MHSVDTMHLRTSRVTRNGKTYEYHQLVESFRREPDGMPATRVLASLGQLDAVALDNLKLAISASRDGRRLVLPAARTLRSSSEPAPIVKPTSSLRYLDLAVLLELWRGWQLGDLIGGLMGSSKAEASAADVVAALTIQRCVAPRSKLYAQRWFPRTALPELTGIDPGQFNNTRLHRVLEQLDQVTDELMRRLPRMYVNRTGAFASLFMDVTDTWFVGHGSELAQPAKTKEGLYAHKIGIVLLCNEHGYPLRWQVIPGRQHDSVAMTTMLQQVDELSWVGEAPVVLDRAMGKTANIQAMLKTSIRFLTALTASEFSSYTDAIPHTRFEHFDAGVQADRADAQRRAQLGALAVAAGMEQHAQDLYVMDLGKIDMPKPDNKANRTLDQKDKTIEALTLGTQIDLLMREGKVSSYSVAGRRFGLSKEQAHRCRQLAGLTAELQQLIMQGEARGLAINELLRLAQVDASEQHNGFLKLLEQASSHPNAGRSRQVKRQPSSEPLIRDDPKQVRLICYFNPDMFLAQRRAANDALQEIHTLVADLNAKAVQGRSRRNEHSLAGLITERLRKYEMLDVFDIDIRSAKVDGRQCLQIELARKDGPWLKRRWYDGFSILVAHDSLPQPANELCALYRKKDAVEKDFQWIKSVTKVRPIWHRTDPKVRAHVTLCMLSLLLERTLKTKLEQSRSTASSRETIESLEDCRLNRYAPRNASASAYLCTEPTDEQLAILRVLKMQHLTDDAEISERITAR
jgi:transposase